ncbi:MAG: DUF2971 domain-containing protein [Quinella sp. 2Q5]|nr:DUF2971 domain-containing protein [Quinella sp. 2Q5]
MKLYRYRTIKSALAELEDGTFYFAEPRELNDPIEGYAKIFLQGDVPAWEGLLKNFVCSLFYCLQTHLLMAGRFHGGAQENFLSYLQSRSLLPNLQHFDDSSLSRTFDELGEKFLAQDITRQVVDFYGGGIKCYGRELEFILRTVTNTALKISIGKCKQLGLIRDDFDENFFDVAYEISFDELKSATDAERKQRIDELENLNCDLMESGLLALKLNRRTSTAAFRFKQNLLWLQFIFPRSYCDRLKEIIYPDGYVVCFSDTPANSAMWGNYADNHHGICFVYETKTLGGREFINFAAKSLEVKPVKYQAQVIERNFFDTLRYLNFISAEDWLTGRGGVRSSKLYETTADAYDEDYREKFYHKLNDWHHEREYRLFLPDKFYHYSDRFARRLKYDVDALKGIIFGICTSTDDKLELIQRLTRLRKSLHDFEFWQAEYDDETQLISVREKNLLINIQ